MHDGPGPSTEQPDASSPRAETPGTDAADAADAADGLCERDRELLAFERHWWRHAGAKEQAIREQFGMSATRYYQLLNVLLDRPEALVADPMLVKRLRRLRSSRQKARAARRGGGRS
ncbi:MAG: DUF3263 domain-containing protein [Frankiaceae bacterium]